MRKISFVVDKHYLNNRIFDLDLPDVCFPALARLRERLRTQGFELNTQDINKVEDSIMAVYSEMPEKIPRGHRPERSILIIWENEVIAKKNWVLDKHAMFERIITWHDDFVDNVKYFKFNYSYDVISTPPGLKGRDKLVCLISSGNKSSTHPLELYSKRLEAIRWFEKNRPEDFDYYGRLWNKSATARNPVYMFLGKLGFLRTMNRRFLKGIRNPEYPPKKTTSCYRGEVEDKIEVMRKYKFSICYENAQDIPGYITEKIFDCYFANCVPVYWGAPNIEDYMDRGCFIDKRSFGRYEDLYSYLAGMGDREYLGYQENISSFLSGPKIDFFKNETQVDDLFRHIVGMAAWILGKGGIGPGASALS